MTYLSAAQVLFIHARLIAETGGAPGLRDLGLLESAVARPRATFAGVDLYPDIHQKAAALMESLVQNHPFVDGNKRVGIASATLFLVINGWRLVADNQALETFTWRVARAELTLDQMAAWFKNESVPVIGEIEN